MHPPKRSSVAKLLKPAIPRPSGLCDDYYARALDAWRILVILGEAWDCHGNRTREIMEWLGHAQEAWKTASEDLLDEEVSDIRADIARERRERI